MKDSWPGGLDLPADVERGFNSELEPGERLLWTGQPRAGRVALQAIPLVLIGIPFTGFAIFWMAMASASSFPGPGRLDNGPIALVGTIFPLFGIPFVLVGLGMLSSPFWMIRKAKRTSYALTDRRAILREATAFGGVEVRQYREGDLGPLRRVEYPGGEGDLIFEDVLSIRNHAQGRQRLTTRPRGFLAIDGVREVEGLVRRTLGPERGRD